LAAQNESFDLTGPTGRLEAILMQPEGVTVAAAVVCHAHPQHGGMMHFKVVFRAAKTLQASGIPALRFNFRGVGRSEGFYDEGRGEVDDARAALDDMAKRFPGVPLVLGGFSFGSWVALRAGAQDSRVRALFALGFPLRMVPDTSFLAGTHQAAPFRARGPRRVRFRGEDRGPGRDPAPAGRLRDRARERPLLQRPSRGDAGGPRDVARLPPLGGAVTIEGLNPAMSLLRPERALILAVDLQEKLLPAIEGADRVVRNAGLVLRLGGILGIPVLVTTQYRKGLGDVVPEVRTAAPGHEPLDKTSFGCFLDPGFVAALAAHPERDQIVVAGVESHICVAQTVLGALEKGYQAHVLSDAVGSRTAANREVGLRRMERAGALVSSAEMCVYELLGRSDSPAFKQMLPFLKGA
jgi:alpha/beta superfamily hydrolase/nicotinamidase-related amidase